MKLFYYSFISHFYVFLCENHCNSGSWKQRKGRIQVFRKSTIGRQTEAFGRRFGAEKNQKRSLIRKKSGPELDHSGPDFDRLGTHFWCIRAPILRVRGPILNGLYIEKCVFDIGVHDFREKRHSLERRLCRSGERPSKLIVNHPILVWILVFMLVILYFSYE